MLLVSKPYLQITTNRMPKPYQRIITPFDSEEVIQHKKEKPFKLAESCTLFIRTETKYYTLHFEQGYCWDGATIPRIIWGLVGSPASVEFLLSSMVHDKMCECKYLIDNDRYLSSVIFKELLLACKVHPIKANIMFFAVDGFQKTQKW